MKRLLDIASVDDLIFIYSICKWSQPQNANAHTMTFIFLVYIFIGFIFANNYSLLVSSIPCHIFFSLDRLFFALCSIFGRLSMAISSFQLRYSLVLFRFDDEIRETDIEIWNALVSLKRNKWIHKMHVKNIQIWHRFVYKFGRYITS